MRRCCQHHLKEAVKLPICGRYVCFLLVYGFYIFLYKESLDSLFSQMAVQRCRRYGIVAEYREPNSEEDCWHRCCSRRKIAVHWWCSTFCLEWFKGSHTVKLLDQYVCVNKWKQSRLFFTRTRSWKLIKYVYLTATNSSCASHQFSKRDEFIGKFTFLLEDRSVTSTNFWRGNALHEKSNLTIAAKLSDVILFHLWNYCECEMLAIQKKYRNVGRWTYVLRK